MTKKIISVQIADIEFYGDLDESIKLLQDHKTLASKNHIRLYLDGNMESRPYEDHEYYVLRLMGTREENDEEYASRMANVLSQKQWREDTDRKQYEALKLKFEVQ